MADSPLFQKMRDRARALSNRAVDELLNSDTGSEAVGAAVRGAQRGRRTLNENSGRIIEALGLATTQDLLHIEKKIGMLRKRIGRIIDSLE